MNQITLLGRLAKDPEMRYTESGIAVTRFTIAVARESDRNKVDFIHCLAFRKQAESMAEFCRKGRQILLSGRLEINTRKNSQTDKIDSFTNVIANRIEFLAKPKEQQPAHQQQSDQQQQQRFQPTDNGWANPSDVDLPF